MESDCYCVILVAYCCCCCCGGCIFIRWKKNETNFVVSIVRGHCSNMSQPPSRVGSRLPSQVGGDLKIPNLGPNATKEQLNAYMLHAKRESMISTAATMRVLNVLRHWVRHVKRLLLRLWVLDFSYVISMQRVFEKWINGYSEWSIVKYICLYGWYIPTL